MKRFRAPFAFLIALTMVGTLAGPAAANGLGVFAGIAKVGKTASFCNHDGTSDVGGPGIGLPIVNGTKQGFWSINTRDTITINQPPLPPQAVQGRIVVLNAPNKPGPGVSTGHLAACGQLTPVGKAPVQLGAACGMSKGHNGKGRVVFDPGTPKAAGGVATYSLHNIVWKLTVVGTLPITASGKAGALAKGEKGTDFIVGVIQAQGGQQCLTKAGAGTSKTGGATQFTVAGAFLILNGLWDEAGALQNAGPLCKNTGDPTCLYKTKKPQTTKRDG